MNLRYETEFAETVKTAEGGIATTVGLARRALNEGRERSTVIATVYESYRETVADQIDMAIIVLTLAIATVQLAEAEDAAAVTA